MGKAKRLKELQDMLADELSGLYAADARVLLLQFVNGFKVLKYRKQSVGWARVWYTFIAGVTFIDGYMRDVRVNSTTGKFLFGEYAKFGTLTATLIRVKQAKLGASTGAYVHPKYGTLSMQRYNIAVQICRVLSDYDEGHC